jgi:hypothetical protein
MVIQRVFIAITLALALGGCYKDDTDIASLTTNPLDPDYTGPSYIEILSSQAEVITSSVTAHTIVLRVNSSIFPSGTSYDLNVKDLTTGDEVQIPATPIGSDDFTYKNFDITLGQEYCYEFSVRVDFSTGRIDRFCDTL